MNRLTRCPRPYCGGAILWGTCLLCGRGPTSPATVGTHHQRPECQVAALLPIGNIPTTERQARDPYLDLAIRLGIVEVESIMATPPSPIRYSLRAAVDPPQTF